MGDAIPRRGFLRNAGAAGTAAAASMLASATSGTAQMSVTSPALPMTAAADIIFKNGKVITVDPAFAIASSVAISGDRIVAVGSDEATAALAGPATRIIDLKSRPVIPGITDGHAHMDREGLRSIFPSLGRVRSIRDIQDRIAELARGKAPGDGAYLTFDEDKKGSLEPGKFADLAVLSADPLTVEEQSISNIRSLMTMVGGKIVYETENWSG